MYTLFITGAETALERSVAVKIKSRNVFFCVELKIGIVNVYRPSLARLSPLEILNVG
jgi:hypothetical protein